MVFIPESWLGATASGILIIVVGLTAEVIGVGVLLLSLSKAKDWGIKDSYTAGFLASWIAAALFCDAISFG